MVIESPADEALAIWGRFKSAFEERTAENLADRFHPFSSLSWSLRLEDAGFDDFQERTTRSTRKALTRSITQGIREATVDLPLMTWLKERQGLLADFLRNSMGNVREEEVSPGELSYHLVERSWWDRLSETGGLRYGIRPFRTTPYAYAGIALKDGEKVFMLANIRYVFREFTRHKFELALSIPLTQGFAIDVGASYQLDGTETKKQLTLKLFKQFNSGSVCYLAMEAREHPALYAGLSFAW